MATVRSLYVSLSLRTGDLNKSIIQARNDFKEFEKVVKPSITLMNDLGKAAITAGKGLTAAVTAPIVAVGVLAVKAAADFESSFAGVRKTVEATEPEFKQLEATFRSMSKTIPISVNELNKIGEAAGQLGIKKDDIAAFAKVMADLGVTTNLTSGEAATATATIQNVFGAAGKDVDRFGATLVALGNAGASTEKDIIMMAQRIAGTGHLVGLSQAQVLSFASALSSLGINAEAGGSAISRVFLKMQDAVMGSLNLTKKELESGKFIISDFAKAAGMSAEEFRQKFQTDAAGATIAFISGLSRIKAEGKDVNGVIEDTIGKSIIIKDTLLRASGAGQLMADTLALGNQAWEANKALVDEAKIRYGTFESQIQLLKNRVGDVAITLGTALLPILLNVLEAAKPLIDVLAQAAQRFADMPKPVQAITVALAAAAAAIGPVLIGVGTLVTGITGLIAPIGTLITWLGGSAGLTAALGTVGAVLTGPVGIIAAITAAVGAITYFALKNKDVRDALLPIWNSIKTTAMQVWESLVELVGTAADSIMDIWREWGPSITRILGIYWETILTQFRVAVNTFGPYVRAAFEIVGAVLSAAFKTLEGTFKVWTGLLTGDWSKFADGIKTIWGGMWEAIKTIVTAPLKAIRDSVGGFAKAIEDSFLGMYERVVGHSYVPDLMEGIKGEFGRLPEIMVDPAQKAADQVSVTFGSLLETGKKFVTDWKGALTDLIGSIDIGKLIKGDLGGAFGGVLSSLGIGGGSGGSGGGLPGIFGGGGGASGTPTGIAAKLNPVSMGLDIANGAVSLFKSIFGSIGAGHKAADEIVKAQNALVSAISGVFEDKVLSPTNRLKLINNLFEEFQDNAASFAAVDPNNAKVVNQAFSTLIPWLSNVRRDLTKEGANENETAMVGGGNNIYIQIYQKESQDTSLLVQEITRYLESNAFAARRFGEALP